MIPIDLHPDRLFPADPSTRQLARALYATVRDLPIVSPHGHTDPQWYADNAPFAERGGVDGAIRDLGDEAGVYLEQLNEVLPA